MTNIKKVIDASKVLEHIKNRNKKKWDKKKLRRSADKAGRILKDIEMREKKELLDKR